MEKSNITLVEVAHANEMQEDLRRRLIETQETDRGPKIDSLRNSILSYVVNENYEIAIRALESYVEDRGAYPEFQERAERFVRHCQELIEAVKTKRNFPGYASLTLSKQQELHDRVLDHFKELKYALRHMEKIEREVKIIDLRSTVWVLRSFVVTVGVIYSAAFFIDLRAGFFNAFINTTEYYIDEFTIWVFGFWS